MSTKKNKQKTPNAERPALNTERKTQNAERRTRYLNTNIIVTFIFILFCYWLLVVKNGYMLQWYDEMSFFESTRFFFRQSLYYPGGLLRYAGTWITQLMYYPFLGSTVIILLWLLICWLTKRAFNLSWANVPFAFIVPMALLVSIVQLDEAWLSMKSMGFVFSNTLGYLFTVVAICVYRLSERNRIIAMAVLLITVACYFIAGFYALLAAVIGIILMIGDSIRSKKYLDLVFPALVVATLVVLPNLYYTYFHGTTVDNQYPYLKGLPDFLIEPYDKYLWKPFIVATACLVMLALLSVLRLLPSNRFMQCLSLIAVCVCGFWSVKAEQKNEQLRATVHMLRHLEENDWTRMTNVMSHITEPPNYTMRILNNLAVVSLGGENENLSGYKPRNIDARHAEAFTITAFIEVPVNYYIGKFNQSYRWAMEHSVQYGKRVFFLKYMIKDALLKDEIKLAKRYNDLLLRTMFHRKWAEEMNRYIEDPSLIPSNPEFNHVLMLSNSQ